MAIFGLFGKEKKQALDSGLSRTRTSLLEELSRAIVGKSTIDGEVLDQLEEVLLTADVGVKTTLKIIERLESRVARDKFMNISELRSLLKEEITALLADKKEGTVSGYELPINHKPYVLMVVGVNGVGKTTTIGKMATHYQKNGKKVILGAADTFRAAAVDQLKTWAERAGATVIDHGMNSDPASVAYDAVKAGVDLNADLVIVDTAGRLHTKVNLMAELSKIKRVMQKVIPDAPHEVLLVLDGSTGQNAVVQAREFGKATDISSLAVTKLDGTAKGGVVIGISDEFQIPVKYIGVGERVEDLQIFDKNAFVDSLLDENIA